MLLFFGLWLHLILIAPVWQIYKKAGFNPMLSLWIFVPFVGWLIVLIYLAIKEWPSMLVKSKEA